MSLYLAQAVFAGAGFAEYHLDSVRFLQQPVGYSRHRAIVRRTHSETNVWGGSKGKQEQQRPREHH